MSLGASSSLSSADSRVEDERVLKMIGHVHCIDRAVSRLQLVVSNACGLAPVGIRESVAAMNSVGSGMSLISFIVNSVGSIHRLLKSTTTARPIHQYFLAIYSKYQTIIAESISALNEVTQKIQDSNQPC